MKRNYLFYLFIIVCLKFQGQTNCSEADSDLIYAYSDIKTSYESNNISHLKYNAHKSLEAFKLAKPKLKSCGCEASYNLVYDAIELLERVDPTETYEDGRFYVKRVRELAKQSIIELDKCTAGAVVQKDNSLETLQNEQEALRKQQMELKAKEKEIQLKLKQQQEKELTLQKEQKISEFETVLSTSLKNYNDILKICNCESEITAFNENSDTLKDKNLEEIKTYYIKIIKSVSSDYLSALNSCTNQ